MLRAGSTVCVQLQDITLYVLFVDLRYLTMYVCCAIHCTRCAYMQWTIIVNRVCHSLIAYVAVLSHRLCIFRIRESLAWPCRAASDIYHATLVCYRRGFYSLRAFTRTHVHVFPCRQNMSLPLSLSILPWHVYLLFQIGLTIDNLEEVEIVTADGALLRCDESAQWRPVLGSSGRRRQLWYCDGVYLPITWGNKHWWLFSFSCVLCVLLPCIVWVSY